MGAIRYALEIEIYKGKCDFHQPGETFQYPAETGSLCPWLLDSINAMARVLQFGGTLPWKYAGTEYEKHIDNDGVTTEFVRCPDPTQAGIVAKITRRKLERPVDVGWS